MNPEAELFIEAVQGRPAFEPGEVAEFRALWALASNPASLQARLLWFTRGKGTQDIEVVHTESVSAPAAAGEHVFRFRLPSAPVSFSGKLISLVWAVELVLEPGTRHARCEFTLGPGGREIILGSA